MKNLELYSSDTSTTLPLPYAEEGIRAGFPSPAQDYMELSIDLNKELVPHPSSTFYGRVKGDSKKLREQKCCAKVIMVFIYTNRHREDLMQYSQNKVITLPFATNDTVELIAYARMALTSIYREGYQFKKAGVIVSDIANEQMIIRDLFDPRDTDKQKRLLSVIDEINRKNGSNRIQLAIQAGNHNWKLKREFISHNYTTNLDDLIQISCK